VWLSVAHPRSVQYFLLNDIHSGKLRKIKEIKKKYCSAGIGNLIGSLEKCVIEGAELDYTSTTEPQALRNFLKAQEKNLKTLKIRSNFDLSDVSKNLRLEYLDYTYQGQHNISLEFLRQQTDLKFLKLNLSKLSSEDLSMICELKRLEILELMYGNASDSSGLNNLYQLEKLKRLEVNGSVCPNILDHLKFGVFEDLEELDASFVGASVESVREMKRITPNLKKIVIRYVSSNTINAILETFENLEKVKIYCENWEISSEKVYSNIIHLEVHIAYAFEINAEQFTHQFPNLEFFKIYDVSFEVTELFIFHLLSGLKRLKTLEMNVDSESKIEFESRLILPCFEKYGSYLETVHVEAVENQDLWMIPYEVIGFTIEKQPNEGFCFDQIINDDNMFDPDSFTFQ
jgi:hypothetical protein